MKNLAALICLLLASFTAPAFAHEMTNDCAVKAEKIANVAEREASIKACLAQVSSSKNVAKEEMHDKRQHCDTNAQNMKLEGKKKAEYLDHCYNENDFDPKNKPHPKESH